MEAPIGGVGDCALQLWPLYRTAILTRGGAGYVGPSANQLIFQRLRLRRNIGRKRCDRDQRGHTKSKSVPPVHEMPPFLATPARLAQPSIASNEPLAAFLVWRSTFAQRTSSNMPCTARGSQTESAS